MNRRIIVIVAAVALAAVLLATAVAMQGGLDPASAQGQGGNGPAWAGQGQGGGPTTRPAAHPTSDPSRPLTSAEAAGLKYMREEEKLAHDVYAALDEVHDLRVFTNITRSESAHMVAVKRLLDVYSIADPVGTNGPGVFSDPAFTRLYAKLLGQGRQSLAEAVKVGIAIEKLDIADLEARIGATDRTDLKAVYGNLLRASRNHLRAFERQLVRL
jgi:hypothetical protein